MKRILIVASTRAYADGLTLGLRGHDGLGVIGSTIDPAAVPALAADCQPDFVLVDALADGGLDRIAAVARRMPGARIVALGIPESVQKVLASVEAGAAACVPPEASMLELADILAALARREVSCSPHVAAGLFERLAGVSATDGATPDRRLTHREAQILALVDEGMSNKEIARRLHIQVSTVKNHVHNILHKLQVSRRGEAVAHVRRRGRPSPDVVPGPVEGAGNGLTSDGGTRSAPLSAQ